MRQFAAILLLTLGYVSQAGAQSFLDQLRAKKPGEGTVTVNQSAAIDELVNKAKLTAQPKQQDTKPAQPHNDKDSTAKKPEQHQAATKKELTDETAKERHAATHVPEKDSDISETANVKKVPRVNRKVTGYRVQAFAGGNSRTDRTKAENIKNAIKARYPELPVYVHFYSPRWICRVGNFRTFNEASTVLKEIKAMGYKQACIVKGKINAGY